MTKKRIIITVEAVVEFESFDLDWQDEKAAKEYMQGVRLNLSDRVQFWKNACTATLTPALIEKYALKWKLEAVSTKTKE